MGRGVTLRSPYFDRLRAEVQRLGGLHNAHLHLGRAYTLDVPMASGGGSGGAPSSHVSLPDKHDLISVLHASEAYRPARLRQRLTCAFEELVAAGTRVADTLVDVTDDGLDMSALDVTLGLSLDFEDRVAVRAAAYNPLGFRDDRPRRWELLEAAAERAHFVAGLPEIDDHRRNPEHVGFEESCVRLLDLAARLDTFVHLHMDQRHEPGEDGTETLVEIVRRGHGPRPSDGEPRIWAVHVISPSSYAEERFERLVDGLLETGIGVICCPTAALGMRQLRPLTTPTGNSIARVLELAAAGVPVRLGSDNVCDLFSPSTTTDLVDEVYVLSAAVRYYDIGILAKLATGTPLDDDDRAVLREHLERNRAEIARCLGGAG